MPYTLPQGFQIGNQDPIDSRITVADAGARKGFSVNNVFEGLIVYQQNTDELYVLTDPANVDTDAAWSKIETTSGSSG